MFISSCHFVPAKCFATGNKEIKSKEGTTHEDIMDRWELVRRVTRLLYFLQEFILVNEQGSKEVAFAHDFSVKGKIKKIKTYWEILQQVGQLHGYFPKLSKFCLIVKEREFREKLLERV